MGQNRQNPHISWQSIHQHHLAMHLVAISSRADAKERLEQVPAVIGISPLNLRIGRQPDRQFADQSVEPQPDGRLDEVPQSLYAGQDRAHRCKAPRQDIRSPSKSTAASAHVPELATSWGFARARPAVVGKLGRKARWGLPFPTPMSRIARDVDGRHTPAPG